MVNGKAPSTFYDLVQGIRGKKTIGNWDVLVSYDEATLNARLAEQADKNKLLEDVIVETSILNTRPHKLLPVHVTLKLSSPVLSFGPGDDEAHLSLNLGGHFLIDDDKTPTPFPDTYRIDIRTSLKATVGHLDDGHFKKSEVAHAATAGAVLGVPDDPSLVAGVYLDFPKASTDWKIIDKDGTQADGAAATEDWQLIARGMESFLAKQNTRWFIGGTKRSESNNNEIRLVPETFRFTILTPDPSVADSKGCVCMWIKVKGSQGQSNGTEGFNKFDTYPIPKGHTASVVFSHALLVHSVLKPSLESSASNWMNNIRPASDKDGDPDDGTWGVHLKADCSIKNEGEFSFFSADDLKPTIDIKINPDIVTPDNPSLHLTWDSKENLHSTPIISRADGMGGGSKDLYRQLRIRGSGAWSGQGTEIDMTTTVSRSLHSRESTTVAWTFQGQTTDSAGVSMSANVKPLQYLLATNLLFPNQNVFSADPVQGPRGTAQGDIQGGLACPHDLVLTGNLVKGS